MKGVPLDKDSSLNIREEIIKATCCNYESLEMREKERKERRRRKRKRRRRKRKKRRRKIEGSSSRVVLVVWRQGREANH